MKQVVITGVGLMTCIGDTKELVMDNLNMGKTGVADINYFDTDFFSSSKAGSLPVEKWEEISKLSAEIDSDVSVALSILTIKKAILDSGLTTEFLHKCGVSIGTCNGGINSLEKFIDKKITNINNYSFKEHGEKVRDFFGLNSHNYVFNSACSASGSAIAFASDIIKFGEADIMIAGGTDAMSEFVYAGFNSLKAMNKDFSTPYGEKVGLNLGEGSAFIVLESLESALSRNAHIYGEVMGYGLTNDAYHMTAPRPEGQGIFDAINKAMKMSNIEESGVWYINSHGTGTLANDSSELKGILSKFSNNLPYISSFKGYTGHTLGAAAAIEVAITLIGLEEKKIFPSYNLQSYRADCEYEEIFKEIIYVDTLDDLTFLNINAAFGGHNCVLAITKRSEYPLNTYEDKKLKDIYIHGYSTANIEKLTYFTCDNIYEQRMSGDLKVLKNYNSSLYERRMNLLTQLTIASVNRYQEKNIGFIFGTDNGSLSSVKKYVDSICQNGKDKVSSILFPEVVVNSTPGRVAKVLGLDNVNVSLSDYNIFNILYAGSIILQTNEIKSCIINYSTENNNIENYILGKEEIGGYSSNSLLISTQKKGALCKISSIEKFQFKNSKYFESKILSYDVENLNIINFSQEKINLDVNYSSKSFKDLLSDKIINILIVCIQVNGEVNVLKIEN